MVATRPEWRRRFEGRLGILLLVEEQEMCDASTDQGGQWSELQSELIGQACSRFETAWRTGGQPRIEDFLPAGSQDENGRILLDLLQQLVGIDVEWRWKTAATPEETQAIEKMPSPPAPLPSTGEGSETRSPRPGHHVPMVAGEGQGVRAVDASFRSLSLPFRPRLADYVARYPLLGPVEQLPNDLIVTEYYARCCYGDRPTHAEYLDAFGSRHADLAGQLQAIDAGLAAAEQLIADTVLEDGPPPGGILRYWLATPASEYLRGLGPSAALAADWPADHAAAAMTLGELFQRADPPLGLLIAVKRHAQRLLHQGTNDVPADVHRMIYFASIAAATLRHGQQISKSSPEVLRTAWKRLAAESYAGEELQRLFASALERHSKHGGCNE